MAPRCALASDCLHIEVKRVCIMDYVSTYNMRVKLITDFRQIWWAPKLYLRIEFAPAVASGLSWNLVRSYNGASNKQNRITEIVTSTDLPACVLVSLQMNIVGRANGRGSNNDKPSTPSIPQKANSGMTKPNIAASGIRSVRYVCFAYL